MEEQEKGARLEDVAKERNFESGRRGRPRTVLVLGGGGMRGMAHVGVLRALRELGIKYDAIVATSIGSLVGGLAATGADDDEIEDMVTAVQKGDYFKLNFGEVEYFD